MPTATPEIYRKLIRTALDLDAIFHDLAPAARAELEAAAADTSNARPLAWLLWEAGLLIQKANRLIGAAL